MTSDRELKQRLRELGNEVAPSPSIVEGVMKQVNQSARAPDRSPRADNWRYRVMQSRTLKVLIPTAAAAAILLVVGLWPNPESNGIVWADVVRQLQTARTARLKFTMHDHEHFGSRVSIMEYSIKAPNLLRVECETDQFGKMSIVANGNETIQLLHERKLFQRPQIRGGNKRNEHVKRILDNLLPFSAIVDPDQTGEIKDITRVNTSGRLVSEGTASRNEMELHRYRFEPTTTEPATEAERADRTSFYWFDKDHVLRLITQEKDIDGEATEIIEIAVELNPDLPDGLFSTDLPPGYIEATEVALGPFMPDEVRILATQYYKEREQIGQYRLIAWETSPGLLDMRCRARAAKDGSRWRVDGFRSSPPDLDPEQDFATLWEQLSDAEPGNSVIALRGQPAAILRRTNDKGQLELKTRSGSDGVLDDLLLAEAGWPAWPGDHPALVKKEDATQYTFLPADPNQPGQIGLRIISNGVPDHPGSTYIRWKIYTYWLDPSKDYLCMRYEKHERRSEPWRTDPDWQPTEPVGNPAEFEGNPGSEQDLVWEILEVGQTPDGRWYPLQVRRERAFVAEGVRYPLPPVEIRFDVDLDGPIPDAWLDWPKDIPEPDQD